MKDKNIKLNSKKKEIKTKKTNNVNILLDVTLDVHVEFGKRAISLEEVLHFEEGTVIELNKPADDPIDIVVNHRPIARGEVVVIDETFGIRLTEVLHDLKGKNEKLSA